MSAQPAAYRSILWWTVRRRRRKSARRHGLSTDASYRFERGIDPNGTIYALKQAAILCKQLAGGKVSMEIKDVYPTPIADARVQLDFEYVDRLIGKKIGNDMIKSIVESLDMKIVEETAEGLLLDVPAYRVDVQIGRASCRERV